MKDRLLFFMNRENISATSLADEIGVQRSSISHILSGRNNPSYDFIYKIITRYEHMNAEWLITGKGDMYKKEPQPESEVSESEMKVQDEQSNQSDVRNKNESMNIQAMTDTEKSMRSNEISKVTNVNKIEKIVYFYKNGTFREYNPSE